MWHREKPDPMSVSDDNVSPVWPKRGGPGDIRIINQNEPQREETSTKPSERAANAWEEGAATRLADSERGAATGYQASTGEISQIQGAVGFISSPNSYLCELRRTFVFKNRQLFRREAGSRRQPADQS